MKKRLSLCFCLLICLMVGVLSACSKDDQDSSPPPSAAPPPVTTPVATWPPVIDPSGNTLLTRFNPPEGYVRVPVAEGSFGAFLRDLPLKEDGAPVLLLDGTARADVPQAAVILLDISGTSKQSGPRSMVRLRAEYLYSSGQTNLIVYHFLSGFTFPFSQWCEGYRVKVDGKQVEWVKSGDPSNDYKALLGYLNTLFVYSNTRALQLELMSANDAQLGDVFINSDSGAVMIADMAQNPNTGDTLFMLARGSSPTQDIYILQNVLDTSLSPWYSALYPLVTPEGEFTLEDLGRFNESPELDGE